MEISNSDIEPDSEEYRDGEEQKRKPRQVCTKRRKIRSGKAVLVKSIDIPRAFFDELGNGNPTVTSFQEIIDKELVDYLKTRARLQEETVEADENGDLRPPTRAEVSSFITFFEKDECVSTSSAISQRKLKLIQEKRRARLPETTLQAADTATPLPSFQGNLPPHQEVIDAFYDIKTTPYTSSFLSRIRGNVAPSASIIAIDWETTTPWMSLMSDIREHYVLSYPGRERSVESLAPITYTTLAQWHLREVHDLLERSFWKGINVSDSLDHSPERCTIIALYKRLVVGVAILSSPRETYITYLAVRAGWDNAGIARSMLYHLVMLNPKKDITLHVSVNNPAMLLYNQFGFKAEQFVAGFYEAYLDPNSRASKNAFLLRLRQQ